MLMESGEERLDERCTAVNLMLIEIESKMMQPAVFIEPAQLDDVLYLFGAGHFFTFVALRAKIAGFRVIVIDNRQAFANAQRFPNADRLIVFPFEEAFDQILFNWFACIGIITRGLNHDRETLRSALNTRQVYIGMISSCRKKK